MDCGICMVQSMVCPGECSPCPWEERVLCCSWMACSVHICSAALVDSFLEVFNFLADFLPNCYVHYWKWSIEVSSYYGWSLYFSQFGLFFFASCFPGSVFRHICICNCWLFFMGRPFRHFISFLSQLRNRTTRTLWLWDTGSGAPAQWQRHQLSCCRTCGILVPDQGLNPHPLRC